MRDLITGATACPDPAASSSSANPFGSLANALIGSSSKTQERLNEIPTSTPTDPSAFQLYSHPPTSDLLPGSEFDKPLLDPNSQVRISLLFNSTSQTLFLCHINNNYYLIFFFFLGKNHRVPSFCRGSGRRQAEAGLAVRWRRRGMRYSVTEELAKFQLLKWEYLLTFINLPWMVFI